MGIAKLLKSKFRKSGTGSNVPVIIGIPGIDAQHDEFFRMCEAVLERLKRDSFAPDVVSKSFNEIIDHLKNHFFTEENLFEIIGFPKAEEHKTEHVNLLAQILREEAILKNSDKAEAAYFISTFKESFMNHIMAFDKPYTGHIEKLVAIGKKFKITTLRAQTLAK